MLTFQRFRSHRILTAIVLTATLLWAGPVAAQTLTVESKSIGNGEVNVPTNLDISITFSAPLSPLGVPEVDLSGLPIQLDLIGSDCPTGPALIVLTPEGCPESFALSPDGRTLTLQNVTLAVDQVHTMLVLFAVSAAGDLLAGPDVTRFTTGASIPQGSISGTVSGDVDEAGSLVLLAPGGALDVVAGGDTTGLDALIGFADEDGNYTVSFVPDDDYFVLGLKFEFGILGGLLRPASKAQIEGVAIGLHDQDGDGITDPVTVADGGSVEGVDIVLSSTGLTLANSQAPVEELIKSEVPTARLSLAAGGGLEPDGTALVWVYVFTDLLSGQAWVTAGIGDKAFPPELLPEDENLQLILQLLSTAVFTDYADSDEAMDWYMAAGGQEFLAANPYAVGAGILMDRALFEVLLEVIEGGEIGFVPGLDIWREVFENPAMVDPLDRIFSKTQSMEAWVVAFVGTDEDLVVHLVAMADDGTPLLVLGSSAAGDNSTNADQAASAWQSDAELVNVSSAELPVSAKGASVVWAYDYYSAAKDSVLELLVSGGPIGGVISSSMKSKLDLTSTETLIGNWIDSPEALAAADKVAAGFIAGHSGVTSTAELSMGFQEDHPERAIWRVTYTGGAADGTTAIKVVDIDASNGVFVAVEADRSLPGAFALEQNYPNPFNPETVIGYHVDRSGPVKLTVFNTLGQTVRVLVDAAQTEGAHQVRWDATDATGRVMPSGVYLCRLEAAGIVESRRMTLSR